MLNVAHVEKVRIHVMLCLLLLCCCCLRSACVEVAHLGKNGGYVRGLKWDTSDERKRIEKIAYFSPGRSVFDAEFQVWRGRIPEKWSKNGPFPLGGDCLERRDRCSPTG